MADPVTAAIGGGLTLGNAVLGSKSAKRQERAISQAADQSTALQREIFEKQSELFKPFLEAGQNALPFLAEYLSQKPELFQFQQKDYTQTPEYQQMQQQAEQSILRNQAATGGLRGGSTQTALAGVSPQILQQLRNEDYQRQLQQYSVNQGAQADQFNRLMGIAGLGFGGAQQTGSAAGQFGSAAAQNLMTKGQAKFNRIGQQQQMMSGLFQDIGSMMLGGGF